MANGKSTALIKQHLELSFKLIDVQAALYNSSLRIIYNVVSHAAKAEGLKKRTLKHKLIAYYRRCRRVTAHSKTACTLACIKAYAHQCKFISIFIFQSKQPVAHVTAFIAPLSPCIDNGNFTLKI